MEELHFSIQEEGFRAFFDSEQIVGVVLNEELIIEEASNGFAKRFPLSPDRMLMEPITQLLHNKELDKLLSEHMEQRLKRNKAMIPFVFARGQVGFYIVEIINMYGMERPYYLLLLSDETEHLQTQITLDTMLAMSKELFLLLDYKQRVLYCSEHAAHIFGFSNRMQAMGVHYSTFLYERLERNVVQEVFAVMKEKKSLHKKVEFTSEGKTMVYEMHAVSVSMKGERLGMMLQFEKTAAEVKKKKEVSEPLYLEEEKQFSIVAEQEKRYVSEKEYGQNLKRLAESLQRYAYIEINEILEQLSLIAKEEHVCLLEAIQRYVMEFAYEEAIREYRKIDRGEA